ncbi:Sporulation protein YlmC, PRC-barrel domain family [Stigmatella aurantiaca]|uniref:Sporulation protein YlmC, PRC-barrel domain family n=1 Tax=Stigmatella aurantiaca TaxID=41 RepID=A0A1H7RNC4_STIAU|nr:PRC-barrel domain-containing protein [Stigmatella aurantiaca]SEL61652.1 Sporulation protein YlmC, PRC-barrel domain family [Stigmatella aurantiaca]
MRLSDKSLVGLVVVTADGQALGEVSVLFIDSQTWHVEAFQVKLRRGAAEQLGASRTLFHAGTIEIPLQAVQSVGDAVVLSVSVAELHQVLPSASASASTH